MPRVVLVLLAALALAACGGEEGSPSPETGSTEPGVSLAGQTLDGESLSLEDFRGKTVFVNVWASW
jgi:hypothetical protein